MKDECRTGTL